MSRMGLIPMQAQINEIVKEYRIVEKEIKILLFTIPPNEYTDLKAMRITDKVNQLIKSLNDWIYKWLKTNIPKSYDISESVTNAAAKKEDLKQDPNYVMSDKQRTINEYIDATLTDYIKANQSIKQNIQIYLQVTKAAGGEILQLQEFDFDGLSEAVFASLQYDDIKDAINRVNFKPGLSRQKASKQIFKNLKNQITSTGFITVKGRNYTAKYYANLVARTRLRQVQTEATINTNKQFGNDLVQVSSHDHESDICTPYEGQIYSLSGTHPIYPQLEESPPFHPNCEHVLLPYVDTGSSFRRRRAG